MATYRSDGVAADAALGIPDQQAERLQGLRSPGGKRLQRRAPHLGSALFTSSASRVIVWASWSGEAHATAGAETTSAADTSSHRSRRARPALDFETRARIRIAM